MNSARNTNALLQIVFACIAWLATACGGDGHRNKSQATPTPATEATDRAEPERAGTRDGATTRQDATGANESNPTQTPSTGILGALKAVPPGDESPTRTGLPGQPVGLFALTPLLEVTSEIIVGPLSPATVRSQLQKQAQQLTRCYTRALADDPTLEGDWQCTGRSCQMVPCTCSRSKA